MAVVTNVGHTDILAQAVGLRLSKCADKSEGALCLCILMDLKLIEAIRLLEALGTRTIKDMQELHSCKLQRQECALIAAQVYSGELPINCVEFTAEVLRSGAYGSFESTWRRLVESDLYDAPTGA